MRSRDGVAGERSALETLNSAYCRIVGSIGSMLTGSARRGWFGVSFFTWWLVLSAGIAAASALAPAVFGPTERALSISYALSVLG